MKLVKLDDLKFLYQIFFEFFIPFFKSDGHGKTKEKVSKKKAKTQKKEAFKKEEEEKVEARSSKQSNIFPTQCLEWFRHFSEKPISGHVVT